MGLSRYWDNDSVRIVGAAAAGYLVNEYAPQLSSYATTVRQAIQSVRKSIFKGADSNVMKTAAQNNSIASLFGGARSQDASRIDSDRLRGSASTSQGGFWESIKNFLRLLLA